MSTQTTTPPTALPAPGGKGNGGRAALRILVVGVGLALVAYYAVAVASLLSRAYETRAGTYRGVQVVDLDLSFEEVEVVGSPSTTEVRMSRGYHWSLSKPEIVTRQVGDRLVVRSSCRFTPGLPCTGWVRLTVPAALRVAGGSTDGHLTLRSLTGPVDVETSDGGITVSRATGGLRLQSRDGTIEGSRLRSADVHAASSDGSVHLVFSTPPRSVVATSRDGSVELILPDDGTTYDVRARATDGSTDVSVPTDPKSTRHLTARTSDGSIRIAPQG